MSDRLLVQLTSKEKEAIRLEAAYRGTTQTQLVREALAAYLGWDTPTPHRRGRPRHDMSIRYRVPDPGFADDSALEELDKDLGLIE